MKGKNGAHLKGQISRGSLHTRALLEDSGHVYLAHSTAIAAADDCHGQETQVLLGRCSSNCNLIHCHFGLSIGVWVLRGLP